MKLFITIDATQAQLEATPVQQVKDDLALIFTSVIAGKTAGSAFAPGITYDWSIEKDDVIAA